MADHLCSNNGIKVLKVRVPLRTRGAQKLKPTCDGKNNHSVEIFKARNRHDKLLSEQGFARRGQDDLVMGIVDAHINEIVLR